ncbi:MAG: PDZ domain-containing protein [Micrococcales bacterium]
MTLFQAGSEPTKSPRRHFGLVLLSAAILLGALAMTVFPAPYVIERPGPAFDVLGKQDGTSVISISGTDVYPTSGELDLLTVSLVGNREQTPTWPEIFAAWLDPAQTVTPIDEVYPVGTTVKESEAESVAMMEQSQQNAIFVALKKLGYEIPIHIYAQQVNKNSPSSGKLIAGDYLEKVNGVHPKDFAALRKMVMAFDGTNPLDVQVSRQGKLLNFEISPTKNDAGDYMLGVAVGFKFDFPIKVDLKLSDVGGPSGGMIFALGIYDSLTKGALTGGSHIAGTGTIDTNGVVGPIGGIRQKLYAAQRAGAKYFLAPAENCGEVNGHIPAGLQVFRVKTFDDALTATTAIGSKADLSKLATCASN